MLSRIQRLDLSTMDILVMAAVLGLVAALVVALPVG